MLQESVNGEGVIRSVRNSRMLLGNKAQRLFTKSYKGLIIDNSFVNLKAKENFMARPGEF